ncbi:MAG: tRNA (adenosine(37)-N6)-threonylcarbamoyltransferase complex transferase subunit TsaD [Deltaproteobacteria bacterium]|nr:tRNA (adenosine(37)-N6)-threonylcarbamoyltransferase complex transferase subunit TsaD [Deltaproteobacteria bacterium]
MGSRGLILAVESSCDETAAAVVEPGAGGVVLSSIIHSQVAAHAPYGGVVPEIASREHLARIDAVVGDALADAGAAPADMGVVAATYGPGLVGALLVGLTYAKGFARGRGLPLVGVHHIEGHLHAALADPASPPSRNPGQPFIGLVVSGGHSALYRVDGIGRARLLGQTRDDAAGEAFDKSAKLLGLGYPGGVVIDRLAQRGDPAAIPMPRSLRDRTHYDFSFSGLKTAVRTFVEEQRRRGVDVQGQLLADLCASVQEAIVDALLHKAMLACRRQQVPVLVLGGGVAANSRLRAEAARRGAEQGVEVYLPPRALCTDNAVMIAMAARAWRAQGRSSPPALVAAPDAPVEASSAALS